MTIIIGIFDTARDLDKAVERLARAGFEDTVYDEAIVAEEAGNGGPLVFAPGYAPAMVWGSAKPTFRPKPDRHSVVRAFKTHLAAHHLPDDVIQSYATTFQHNGFLLVKTEAGRADQVVTILRDCGALRANRHG
jgi:hypothetical protein